MWKVDHFINGVIAERKVKGFNELNSNPSTFFGCHILSICRKSFSFNVIIIAKLSIIAEIIDEKKINSNKRNWEHYSSWSCA